MAKPEQISQLNREGVVFFENDAEGRAFDREMTAKGTPTHFNPALALRTPLKANVELCQGAHCHCRY